jgi:HTH-type transcriptional regulator / antitoxin HigA
MTVNVDIKKYSKLLVEFLPMSIRSDEELDCRLVEFEKLLNKSLQKGLSPEEDRMFDLLADLIEKYEDEHHEIDTSDISSLDSLKFLMAENNLTQKDMVEFFGTKSIVSEVLSGKRSISKTHAKKLAQRFCVSTDLFI